MSSFSINRMRKCLNLASHKSTDTERISKMFPDNVFLLFPTKISAHSNYSIITLPVVFSSWQLLVNVRQTSWSGLKLEKVCSDLRHDMFINI